MRLLRRVLSGATYRFSHKTRATGIYIIRVNSIWAHFCEVGTSITFARMRLLKVQWCRRVYAINLWSAEIDRQSSLAFKSLVRWHPAVRQSQVRKMLFQYRWSIPDLVATRVLSPKLSRRIVNNHDFELALLLDVFISSLPMVSAHRHPRPYFVIQLMSLDLAGHSLLQILRFLEVLDNVHAYDSTWPILHSDLMFGCQFYERMFLWDLWKITMFHPRSCTKERMNWARDCLQGQSSCLVFLPFSNMMLAEAWNSQVTFMSFIDCRANPAKCCGPSSYGCRPLDGRTFDRDYLTIL